jgi:SAM-dependent methyltransferase
MSLETFDAGWLALREAVDHRSRSEELVNRLVDWWTRLKRSTVLDLGSGTGSNLRYLAPRLPGRQVWTLIDHDPALLARVEVPPDDVVVNTQFGDLADEGLSEVENTDLVTAAALLDLVSGDWMESLADACAAAECGALFALTYDGTIEWTSDLHDPDDELVHAAVDAHQLRDKGLGAALGPAAGGFAEAAFRRRGFHTHRSPSPWRLGPEDAELAQALVLGWEAAALDERPDEADRIGSWAERRKADVAHSDFELLVGHVDLLALPAGQAPEAT